MKKLLKIVLFIFLAFILFLLFPLGSGTGNEEKTENKEWVLSEESVMGYDSLTNNYEFVGEWELKMEMQSGNMYLYQEFYKSSNRNTCYIVSKENTLMEIKENKRDGRKYWVNSNDEYYEITDDGELLSYDGEGNLQDKNQLNSFGITLTKIR